MSAAASSIASRSLQGDNSIRFRDVTHTRLGDIHAAGAPEFQRRRSVPRARGRRRFDPTEPWRLQLLVQRGYGARDKAFLTFDLGYELPQAYLKRCAGDRRRAATTPPSPSRAQGPSLPSRRSGRRCGAPRIGQIAILLVRARAVLTGDLLLPGLVRAPAASSMTAFGLGFLVFTLVWIGWYAQAQLSVVNVLAFLNALRTDFRWDYFLMAPLIFILWFATAASLLFWNRGAYLRLAVPVRRAAGAG